MQGQPPPFTQPSGQRGVSNNEVNDENNNADEDYSPGEGVHMAVCQSAGKVVGLAWYDPNTGELWCMEGQDDEHPGPPLATTESTNQNPDSSAAIMSHRLVQLARLHAMPSVIYVSSKAQTDLVAALKAPLLPASRTIGGIDTQVTNNMQDCDVRIERAKLFSKDSALTTLEAVHLSGCMHPSMGPRERLHILNTTVSLCREQQVCAAGALLAILSREGLLARDPSAPTASLPLASLKETSLEGHLLVDPGSLEALHIFREESHPSAMGLGRSKEGLSVFGLLNRCVSPPGRRMMRLWFARPLVNVAALEERLDGVDALRMSEETVALKAALRAVKDPCRHVSRLRSTQTLPDPSEFIALQNSLDALLTLRDTVSRLADAQSVFSPAASVQTNPRSRGEVLSSSSGCGAATLFSRLAESISSDLISARQLIASIIDPGQIPEGMAVHYGISEQLDDMKAMYYGLPDLLRNVEAHEVSRLSLGLQPSARASWSVAYIPQVGFLLQVEGQLLGADVLEALPDIELALGHGVWDDGRSGACYHTATTRELNERYGDVLLKIRDLETMICNNMAQELVRRWGVIHAATEAAAEMDCLLSLAEAAVEMRLVRPKLSKENVLEVKGGRHLLAEAVLATGGGSSCAGDSFIPNDTAMGADGSRIHIITGPNLSGKSCYAKQVGLIVFLAHVGSFVPAESATVGLTDRIFTRVVTRESGAVPQSTFMIDLSQVASMLRLSTPRSLLIIDEFGKGTLAADGVGLLCGALSHLAARPVPPRVLLATHFTEVLNPQYLPRNKYLEFYTMAVAVAGEQQHTSTAPITTPGSAPHSYRRDSLPSLGNNNQAEDLVFLYRLTPGHIAPSFGVHCAALAGVDESVVARSRQIIECIGKGQRINKKEHPATQARTQAFRSLVAQLLALDCTNVDQARNLLQAASQAAR